MKTIITVITLAAMWQPLAALAEGKANHDWAEEAAVRYEKKARHAQEKGNAEAAAIYKRMAQIKRDAGAASKQGKDFSWDEYHKLKGKLNDLHAAKHGDKHHAKKHSKEDAGAGFLHTAEKYEKRGEEALKAGDTEKAKILMQMAAIKRQAAVAAREGKGFDWSHYHKLSAKLHKGKAHDKHGHDKHHDKHHDKPHDKHHDKPHDAEQKSFKIE